MRNRVLLQVDVVTKAFGFTLDFKSYVLLEIMQEAEPVIEGTGKTAFY